MDVARPRPGEAGVDAELGRIALAVAALREVLPAREHARVDPRAGARRAVRLELADPADELALLQHLAVGQGDVRPRLPADLLQDLLGLGRPVVGPDRPPEELVLLLGRALVLLADRLEDGVEVLQGLGLKGGEGDGYVPRPGGDYDANQFALRVWEVAELPDPEPFCSEECMVETMVPRSS